MNDWGDARTRAVDVSSSKPLKLTHEFLERFEGYACRLAVGPCGSQEAVRIIRFPFRLFTDSPQAMFVDMDTQDTSQPYRHPDAPWGGWQDVLVSTIRREIDTGHIVHVRLPGLSKPVLIEDAATSASMVVLADEKGMRLYVGSMQGVVVIACDPQGGGKGLWSPISVPPEMSVDD